MSEVIQPSAGQTIITTDEWKHRGDHGHRDSQTVHDMYRAVIRNGEKVLEGFGAASRQGAEGFGAVERQASEVEMRSREELLEGFGEGARQVSEVEGRALVEAAKNAAALGVQSEKNTAALGVQSDRNAAATQLQAQTFASAASVEAAKYANAAGLQAQTFFNASSVEAAKYANAATLQAQVIASTAAAQLAACCCELKEKIGEDGQKTRDLINQIDRERCARELVNANNEVLFLRSQMSGKRDH